MYVVTDLLTIKLRRIIQELADFSLKFLGDTSYGPMTACDATQTTVLLEVAALRCRWCELASPSRADEIG